MGDCSFPASAIGRERSVGRLAFAAVLSVWLGCSEQETFRDNGPAVAAASQTAPAASTLARTRPATTSAPRAPTEQTEQKWEAFPREFQLTSMRGTAHAPYVDGNTIQSIRAAHLQGIHYIEVDLILTRDDSLVTAHQPYVKGCGNVSKMTLSQVLGCRLHGGLKVARLGEILRLPFRGVFLDLKDTRGAPARGARAVARAAKTVVQLKRQSEVVLMLYQAGAAAVKTIRDQGLRAGIKGYPESTEETLRMVREAARLGFEMVSVNTDFVTRDVLMNSTRLGVWHLPWSTDPGSVAHWRELAQAGVGGLIVLHYDLTREQVMPHWVDARTLRARSLP